MSDHPDVSLKVGLLVVAVTWFLFTAYEFIKGAFNIGKEYGFWISLTDTAGAFGLGFRTVAALIAVFTVSFFVFKKDLSRPELFMSIRWILVGEIVCFLALFPCVIWGMLILTGANISMLGLGFFIESTLPVTIESVGIPIVLTKLFFELNPNKPARGAIKWALIAGTFYLFVHWINNTGNWIGAITRRGIEYVTAYPDHILSVGLTTVGLFVLAIYAAQFTKRSIGANSLAELDLRRVGVIITALGLYFLLEYVMWLFLGTNAKWSTWYAWFLGHNMDLWLMTLPLVGVPLLFKGKSTISKS